MKSILHKVVYVLCIYLKFELMALIYVLKEKQITQKLMPLVTNVLGWVLALMLSAILYFPYVLCIILTHPQIIEPLFKKKRKEKASRCVPNFLLSKSRTWKAVI